jgi:hypothetical protein
MKIFLLAGAMFLTFWVILIISVYPFGPDENTLKMELVEINEKGYYFHEPLAEFEDIILVPHKDIVKWGKQDLQLGDKVTGVFDNEGWELHYIK